MAQERDELKSGDTNITLGEDAGEKTNQIKGQIEETRNQMGETIDAIQDKLSFANLSEQVSEHVNHAVETAKDAVYDATIGKAANIMKDLNGELSNTAVIKTIKENPLPFALIGLGAGLFAYQSLAGKAHTGRSRFELRGELDRSSLASAAQSDTLDAASGKLSEVGGKISGVAGEAYEKVSGAVETAYSSIDGTVRQAAGKVGDLGSSARETYDIYLDENPLVLGAVAVALGAAVGMALPATNYEGHLMGDARRQLLDKAQVKASDLIDKTKEVVSEAGRTISEQARAASE